MSSRLSLPSSCSTGPKPKSVLSLPSSRSSASHKLASELSLPSASSKPVATNASFKSSNKSGKHVSSKGRCGRVKQLSRHSRLSTKSSGKKKPLRATNTNAKCLAIAGGPDQQHAARILTRFAASQKLKLQNCAADSLVSSQIQNSNAC